MKKTYMIACLAMALGMSSQSMAQTDPGTANLKHKWTFEDATFNSATSTVDDVVGGLSATIKGAATVSNGALNTTVDASWAEIAGATLDIKSYQKLTISTWFKSVAGGNNGFHFLYYFGDSPNGNGDNCIGYTPARGDAPQSYSRFLIKEGSESGVNATEYDDGVLHHLVNVVDATNMYCYVDGVLWSTIPLGTMTLANLSNSLAYFCKGGWPDPTWKGEIMEFSIYDDALNFDNVKYLYNQYSTVVATNPGTASLKHKWTFADATVINDGTSVKVKDVVGNVMGTLMGSATVADGSLNTTLDNSWVELDPVGVAINDNTKYPAITVTTWFTSETGNANDGFHFLYYFGDNGGSKYMGLTPNRGADQNNSRILIDTGDGTKYINSTEFYDSNLHQMAAVLDPATSTYSYYIDGILVGSTGLGNSSIANFGLTWAYLCKGGWPDATWQGKIHDFSIYSAALTTDNIKYLYDAGPEAAISTGVNQAEKMNQKVYISNNQIVADFESAKVASSQIEIYNIQGSLLSSETFTCNAGLNHKIVKVDYPAGIYMVRLSVAGQTTYTKIVK